MFLLNAIFVGLREIFAHKFRSLLTMLGIVLGVSSLVAMSAIVKGMENGMKEAMIALGGLDKVLTREAPVPVWQSHLSDQAPGRTIRDVEALRRSAPLIRMVSPEMALERVLMSRGDLRVKPSEFVGDLGHVRGAKLVPLGELSARTGELSKERPVVAVCRSGGRSAQATVLLQRAGFKDVANLSGGMIRWRAQHLPVEETRRG